MRAGYAHERQPALHNRLTTLWHTGAPGLVMARVAPLAASAGPELAALTPRTRLRLGEKSKIRDLGQRGGVRSQEPFRAFGFHHRHFGASLDACTCLRSPAVSQPNSSRPKGKAGV